jgi:hypothetical protein
MDLRLMIRQNSKLSVVPAPDYVQLAMCNASPEHVYFITQKNSKSRGLRDPSHDPILAPATLARLESTYIAVQNRGR